MDTHAGSPQPESAEAEWADAGSLAAGSLEAALKSLA